MVPIVDLFRHEPRARVFFGVLTQSALGTGAGYVALLLLAYERFRSPVGDHARVAGGPAAGDGARTGLRCARRPLVAALVRGRRRRHARGRVRRHRPDRQLRRDRRVGAAGRCRQRAVQACDPGRPAEPRRGEAAAAATSAYGAIADFGYTVGPGLAAGVLPFAAPDTIVLANGMTFGISALVLAGLAFGASVARADASEAAVVVSQRGSRRAARLGRPGRDPDRDRRLRRRDDLRRRSSTSAELLFARDDLGVGDAGFAVLAALFGLGVVIGSLSGRAAASRPLLKRRYLQGLLLMACGLLSSGLAPGLRGRTGDLRASPASATAWCSCTSGC